MENCNAGGGGGCSSRRRYYANGNTSRTESTHLRDFLRIKEDDLSRNNSLAGLTLGAVITGDKSPGQIQSTRTLLDIIRDDPTVTKESKKSWKAFKEKLRLRRAGSAWTSTVPIPASDVPIQPNANRIFSRRESVRLPEPDESSRPELFRRDTSGTSETNEMNISAVNEVVVEDEEEEGEGESGEQPQREVRMSLMALLAETDREMGLDGNGYLMDDDEEEEVAEVEMDGGGGGGEKNCCVCMVRHKGSAFIPCGHTFCRLCSRELWVQRGNCPLCNNFILEILDIF